LSVEAFEQGGNENEGGEWPPARKRKAGLPNDNTRGGCKAGHTENKELNPAIPSHEKEVWGPGLNQVLRPGRAFTLAKQTSKEVGNRCEQIDLQHERLPLREKKANCVKEVASLAMTHQTLRSINCTAVFAVSTCDCTNEDRDPRYLVSFPLLGFGVHVRAAYTPRPTTCPS
jgi:hypothetical protein